jgi:uncharacterized protein (TIGR02246 family)
MRSALSILSLVSSVLITGCASCDAQRITPAAHKQNSAAASPNAAELEARLLSLAQEWVDTWNKKDVDRMQQLHSEDFLYGVFGSFGEGRALLDTLRREDFWGVTYTLTIVKPQVRILSSDTALVLFQLVGKSVSSKGTRPYSSLFTLVYQKHGAEWRVVHVHDSEASESSS